MASPNPRVTQFQMKHTLRFTVNYNDTGIATGNRKQTLPSGSIITGSFVQVSTAFNAATTNVLTVGYEASTFANIVTNAQALAGATGLKGLLPPNGAALLPLVGDQDVYAMYTQTGTAATAGVAVVIIEYVPNTDL